MCGLAWILGAIALLEFAFLIDAHRDSNRLIRCIEELKKKRTPPDE